MTEKDDNEFLVRNSVDSSLVGPKSLPLKYKVVIIVVICLFVAGIIITAIILATRGDDSDNEQNGQKDNNSDDDGSDDDGGDDDDDEDQIEVLDPIIINPTSKYTHCIIWLHGLDNCPENFVNLFTKEVPFARKENTKIILMRAPYQITTFNKVNETSWFDLFTFPINNSECYNFTDAIRSRKMVEKIINQEAKELNGKYQNIYVGGHSQGACITLYTAYNFNETLGGVLVCSGILFPQGQIVGDKNKLNVFLAHGDADKAIPFEFHKETVKRIENFEGVQKKYYQGHGHNIADYEKNDMGKFLNDTMID